MITLKHQKGATLIVILLLLVVITLIGTMAIRQSVVSLKVATNGQAQQLLLQNDDAAYFKVEEESNLIKSLISNGMFGAIDGAANKDRELVFCYLGEQADFFDISRSSIMSWDTGRARPTNNSAGMDGYCSASDTGMNFFTSGRRAVITQVAVKFSTQSNQDPFYGMQLGTDDQGVKFEKTKLVKIFTVSVMPTLTNNVSTSNIDTCLSGRMNEVTIPSGTTVAANSVFRDSVTECLSKLNVAYTAHVTEYLIAQDFV